MWEEGSGEEGGGYRDGGLELVGLEAGAEFDRRRDLW